ncbi:MAG: putative metal-binding motif-containing protein [Saprospiraceae bacterium]|nr:putative metal-binding motif-containing protein [Saprospiraceae bacterium]
MDWMMIVMVVSTKVQNTYYADTDNDGYGDASGPQWHVHHQADMLPTIPTATDNNGQINPGATEICNGLDDCDGGVDEGVQNTYYADTDNDGYGDATVTTMACSPPSGYVADNTDCNDNKYW